MGSMQPKAFWCPKSTNDDQSPKVIPTCFEGMISTLDCTKEGIYRQNNFSDSLHQGRAAGAGFLS